MRPLRHLGPGHLDRAGGVAVDPRRLCDTRQGQQRRRRRPVFGDQAVERHRPHPARPDQAQPVQPHRRVALGPDLPIRHHRAPRIVPPDSKPAPRRVNES